MSYHKLHVASSGSLCAGCGDLFREIRRWHDLLSKRHSVIGEENHPQLLSDLWVIVDRLGHTVEQLDDLFGNVISRSRLAT